MLQDPVMAHIRVNVATRFCKAISSSVFIMIKFLAHYFVVFIRACERSGAERKVLPLRVKSDFSDRSPLRSRSAAPRSRSALFFWDPLTAPLRSTWVLARSAPFPLRSQSQYCHKLSGKQLKLGLRVVLLAYHGTVIVLVLLYYAVLILLM